MNQPKEAGRPRGRGRVCSCGRAGEGQPLGPSDCIFCWAWLNSPVYREAKEAGRGSRPRSGRECLHLGERVELPEGGLKLAFCETCPNGGGRLFPVYVCHHQAHGPETIKERNCRVCPGFEERK